MPPLVELGHEGPQGNGNGANQEPGESAGAKQGCTGVPRWILVRDGRGVVVEKNYKAFWKQQALTVLELGCRPE